MVGTSLGPYKILEKLGEGGMGEVYRAHDSRLRRDVAIKVLPALLANDRERLARFEREAQTLAALSHAHIAAVFGFESFGATHALVMELVEGQTLADRVGRGAVPIPEALDYARQIADALEAAHEKAIVHRDLKPANVKVTPDGDVKVLDFGLAKALTPESSGSGPVENSPTLTAAAFAQGYGGPGTQMGMILGTAAYMAPEQARGRPVDRRADVWAFGCVLFELLTGRRAFEGDDITAVLARVIEREPNWDALPAATPAGVRRLLARCLTKEPKARLRDIGEARIAIDEIRSGRDAASTATAPIPVVTRNDRPAARLPWILAGLMAALALAAFAWPRAGGAASSGDQRPVRVELSLPVDVEFFSTPAVSPDAARIAFIGVREGIRQVYLRELSRTETKAVPGTEGANLVTFSPDGASAAILYTDGKVRRLTIQTGVLEERAANADLLSGLSWSADGFLYFGSTTSLIRLPATGGTPQAIVNADTAGGEVSVIWAVPTADSRHVLFTSWRKDGTRQLARIEATPATGGSRHTVVDGAEYVVAVTADRIIFQKDAAVYIAPFDQSSARVAGTPTRVSDEIHTNSTGSPAAGLSQSGTLLFAASRAFSGRLVWVSLDGVERALGAPSRGFQNPRVSPNGRTVAFSEGTTIWTVDIERGSLTKVYTGQNGLTGFPVWSDDGASIIMRTSDGIYRQRADGEGQPALIAGTSRLDYPASVTPKGQYLAMLRITSETGGDLILQPLASAEPRRLVATRAYEGGPMVSPDGKWLAYVSNEAGPMDVYLRPIDGPDRKWAVSSGGGLQPLWSRDGRRIYFRTGQQLKAVDVQTAPEVRLSPPRTLFERRYAFGPNLTIPNFSISLDGKDLLFVREESGSGHLSLVFNWLQNVGK